MKRIYIAILTGFMMCLMFAGCSFSGESSYRYLFTVGSESCSMKEAYVYLANMRGVYADDMGTNLWAGVESGDASAADQLEDLVISRLLYIYCMDQMAKEEDVALSSEEESLIEEAAEAYMETLTEADLKYLDVSADDIAEYYAHFALAEKYYGLKTDDVLLSEAASSDAMEEQMLEEAKAEAIAAEYEEFVSLTVITVQEDAFSDAEDADDADVTTNQFFTVYNNYMSGET